MYSSHIKLPTIGASGHNISLMVLVIDFIYFANYSALSYMSGESDVGGLGLLVGSVLKVQLNSYRA